MTRSGTRTVLRLLGERLILESRLGLLEDHGTETGRLPGGPTLAGESVEVGLKLGVFLRLLAYRVGL